jgi:hypothetical protein
MPVPGVNPNAIFISQSPNPDPFLSNFVNHSTVPILPTTQISSISISKSLSPAECGFPANKVTLPLSSSPTTFTPQLISLSNNTNVTTNTDNVRYSMSPVVNMQQQQQQQQQLYSSSANTTVIRSHPLQGISLVLSPGTFSTASSIMRRDASTTVTSPNITVSSQRTNTTQPTTTSKFVKSLTSPSSGPIFAPLPLSARARRALDDAEYTFDPSEAGTDDEDDDDGDSSASSFSLSHLQRRSSARLQNAATLKTTRHTTLSDVDNNNNNHNYDSDHLNTEDDNEENEEGTDDEHVRLASTTQTSNSSLPSVRELHRNLLNSRLNEAEMKPDVVDKILNHRLRDKTKIQNDKIPEDGSVPDAFEYLVKWKGKSYIHVTWVSPDVIRQEGQGGRAKLHKYWKRCNKRTSIISLKLRGTTFL